MKTELKIVILNKHKIKAENYPIAQLFYVGKGSPLANPFFSKNSRNSNYQTEKSEDPIEDYRTWLEIKILEEDDLILATLNKMLEVLILQGTIYLRCFCPPTYCHASVIKEKLIAILDNLEKTSG